MNDWFEAEQRVERALQLTESQRFSEALAEIDVALSINPNNPTWHAQRGYLLDELGETADAVTAYEQSLALEPNDCQVGAALGGALVGLGHYARAIEIFNDIAKLYPDFEPAYCSRIQAYAELGQHDRAEEMFYLAQDVNADCPHCFFHIGASLAARGQHQRAIFCWQRVLELDPTYIGVNRCMAQAFRAQGRLDIAREYFLRELREDAGNTDLLFELAELTLESGDVSAAAAKFIQILELDPEHVEARFALGKLWLQSGQPARALQCFEEIGDASGNEPELCDFDLKVGEALMQLGRYSESSDWLASAVEQGGIVVPDLDALLMLGNCHLLDKRAEQAADCYRRILAHEIDHPAAHHGLGLSLLRIGNLEAGVSHCLEAVRRKPDFATAMFNAAVGYIQLGNWSEAKAMLHRARRTDPTNPAIQRLCEHFWRHRLRGFFRKVFRSIKLPLGG